MLVLEIGEGAIILRPEGHKAGLVDEGGLLLHEGEPDGDLLEAVKSVRERRGRDVAGPNR